MRALGVEAVLWSLGTEANPNRPCCSAVEGGVGYASDRRITDERKLVQSWLGSCACVRARKPNRNVVASLDSIS